MSNRNCIDWDRIARFVGNDYLAAFAKGEVTGERLTNRAAFTPAAGQVRRLLRERGITEGRRIARKAMKRRGYQFN